MSAALEDREAEVHALISVGAKARLPTTFGEFDVYAFQSLADGKEHAVLARGDLRGATDLPVRIHSECFTGDVMGSLRCDCRDQLEAALRMVAGLDRGAVVYLRQEGRGIGLVNKLRAYQLQDEGADTLDANTRLGYGADERNFLIAAAMLRELGIERVRVLTNNPDKVAALAACGITVADRVPHRYPANEHNGRYLQTKAERFGHLF